MEWFVDAEINQDALNDFFEGMNRSKFEVHTMQIYRGDRRILRLAQEPYSCTDPREVYSLSKMFTSTVVGIAVDHGLVRTEDRLVDIFGRKNASEKMSHMTLKNLLSMNTGHDRCVLPEMEAARDSVEAFFGVEPLYEPGTHFTYNTGASCLLGSVVERVSGRDFFDYACENLFYPLGITDVSWRRCADGRCYGGTGLYASNDDIMKLGRMYKNGGVYHGRRILSSEWIAEASSYVSDNSSNGTPDWCSGYGYQIWLNSRGGYRGDAVSCPDVTWWWQYRPWVVTCRGNWIIFLLFLIVWTAETTAEARFFPLRRFLRGRLSHRWMKSLFWMRIRQISAVPGSRPGEIPCSCPSAMDRAFRLCRQGVGAGQ